MYIGHESRKICVYPLTKGVVSQMMAAFAEKNDASPVSASPSPSSRRRLSGVPEVRGRRGESADTSRTFSMSAKVHIHTLLILL